MAKFATTTEISYSLELLLKDANEFIILVTPYVQIPERFKILIERKLKESPISITVVCRERELSIHAKDWFLSNGIVLHFNEFLHSKCYLNENVAILTSMNLYNYSMINNIEFGMLINKEDDNENYTAIYNECLQLQNIFAATTEIIEIATLAIEMNAVDVRLVFHKESGNEYVHLIDPNDKYLSIKVGDKVRFQSTELKEKLSELINNYVIYTGENINGRWFTFNPRAS